MTDETVDEITHLTVQEGEEGPQPPTPGNPLRPTVTLTPEMLAAVSDALTAQGRTLTRIEASACVNQVLASHFARRKRERVLYQRLIGATYLTEAGHQVRVHATTLSPSDPPAERTFVEAILKREATQAEALEAGSALYRSEYAVKSDVLTFALREHTRPRSRRAERCVVVRRLGRGLAHDPLRPKDSLTLPMSAIPWLRESLAATQMETSAIARRRRQQTAEESGLTDAEGRKAYQRLRTEYVARYGSERVVRAVEKAGRHRARARGDYALPNHFTAFEWLDLVASFRFRCALCGEGEEVELEPHHGRELHRGGSNEIDNIYPLCPGCHYRIHYHAVAFGRGWWERQMLLCPRFPVGSRVFASHPDTRPPWRSIPRHGLSEGKDAEPVAVRRAAEAEILAILPPERLPGSLWEQADRSRRMDGSAFGIVLESPPEAPDPEAESPLGATLWKSARAQVRWRVAPGYCYSYGGEQVTEVPLDHLEPCDPDSWLAEQRVHLERFTAGDMVCRAADFDEATRLKVRPVPGAILRLLPPEARGANGGVWQEARAGVCFPTTGSVTVSVVSVSDLRRLDKSAWLAEQERLWKKGPRVGDTVRQVGRPRNRLGEVLQAGAPEYSELAPSDSTTTSSFLTVDAVPWRPAWAVVRWQERNGTVHEEEIQDLAVLVTERKKG